MIFSLDFIWLFNHYSLKYVLTDCSPFIAELELFKIHQNRSSLRNRLGLSRIVTFQFDLRVLSYLFNLSYLLPFHFFFFKLHLTWIVAFSSLDKMQVSSFVQSTRPISCLEQTCNLILNAS